MSPVAWIVAAVIAVGLSSIAVAVAVLSVNELRVWRRSRAYTYRREIDLTGVKPKGGRRAA